MNLITLSYNYLKYRRFNTLLNISIMALGIMLMSLLILISTQIKTKLYSDARNIDAVIGTTGSPLQLVLATIWHIDIPNGNIYYNELNKIKNYPQIKSAVPISLGDNFKGFRIVGTTAAYLDLYKATLIAGNLWKNKQEAVIGARVAAEAKLELGDLFASSHGLVSANNNHDQDLYKVTGILNKQNNVIDNLIITSLESIWHLHAGHNHDEHDSHNEHSKHDNHDNNEHDSLNEHNKHDKHDKHDSSKSDHSKISTYIERDSKEITAILLTYKHKAANYNFTRIYKSEYNSQIVSPKYEIARILKFIGVGSKTIIIFSSFLILISIVTIVINQLNSIQQRNYDLAIFRTLGASQKKVFIILIAEAFIISALGAIIGLFLAHFSLELIGLFTHQGNELNLTGFIFIPEIYLLCAITILLCLLAALIPALKAYKIDIRKILSNAT